MYACMFVCKACVCVHFLRESRSPASMAPAAYCLALHVYMVCMVYVYVYVAYVYVYVYVSYVYVNVVYFYVYVVYVYVYGVRYMCIWCVHACIASSAGLVHSVGAPKDQDFVHSTVIQ